MRRIGILLSLALLACTENLTPYPVEGGGEVFDCLPNLDGVIESSEFPTLLDTPQDLLIASGVQLDLGGDALELRQELPGETKTPLVAESVEGYWFADEVAPESIVFPLDGAGENLAILHRGAQSVELLGIASAEEGRTLLRYASPVFLLRFPLEDESSWTSESAVTGTLEGLAYSGTDRYEVRVDGPVRVELPHLGFDQSFRIRTRVVSEVDSSGLSSERQQLLLVNECFGELLRANSVEGEDDPSFTEIAELWRFSL